MEKKSVTKKIHADTVDVFELNELDDRLADLVNAGDIDEDGALYGALIYIIDTLRTGKDVHLITVD